MSDPLYLGELARVAVIRKHGSDVVIVNGEVRTPVKAQLGQSESAQNSPNGPGGPQTIARTVDFLVPTADLPGTVDRSWFMEFRGTRYRPASGNGSPPSRDSGRFGLITRVHTVKVS